MQCTVRSTQLERQMGLLENPEQQYSSYTQPQGEHNQLVMCTHCRASQPKPFILVYDLNLLR